MTEDRTLRARAALEQARREYGAFGSLSGETLVQMDEALAALQASDRHKDALLTLVHRLHGLPRYAQYDVERRPSMNEYLSVEQVDELTKDALAGVELGGAGNV